jgi:hypothetical protein
LIWLESADAEKDAIESLKEGNTTYLAVQGFALALPGLSEEDALQILFASGNYKIIEGTSDVACSDKGFELNILASDYAEIYNQTIRRGI